MSQSRGHASSPVDLPGRVQHAQYDLRVLAPYRLDLTVSALRRLHTNMVDVFTPDGEYLRVLGNEHAPVFVRVAQTSPELLTATLDGNTTDHPHALNLVRRILGVDRDLGAFNSGVERVPWLAPLASRMRGVKPPRYPTLWEACVNAIVFQQVSLFAATAIMRRLLLALSSPVGPEGSSSYQFPSCERTLGTSEDVLRGAGLSANKLATLHRVGGALTSGALAEAMLEERASPDAAVLLQQIKGIGPWTATVILLRGLGRLDVFPMNDSSVTRNLAMVGGSAPIDTAGTLDALRPQQGMLYFHLLLARLEARGELATSSTEHRLRD